MADPKRRGKERECGGRLLLLEGEPGEADQSGGHVIGEIVGAGELELLGVQRPCCLGIAPQRLEVRNC